jgi:zinc protease
MPRSLSKLVGLAALLALPAGAQQPETPPPAAPPRDFKLPVPHELRLANGMEVTLIPYGTVPLAEVSLAIRTGSIDEDAHQVWLARLMGDFLPEGTTTHSAADIARATAGMGGSLDVSVGSDQSTISGTVLGDSAAAFIQLLADVVRHPGFPDSAFTRLRANALRELAIARTRPGPLAAEKFAANIYGDHPYGRLYPAADALRGYTAADVRAFYANHVGAARAHLYVVGRFDPDHLERMIRAAFGDWPAGAPRAPNSATPHAGRTLVLVDRPGAVQSTIILGLPVPDPSNADWVALEVTDALLGGSFASRITSNIREQKGYTYSPYSSVDAHYRVATWAEQADVTTAVTGASLKEIFGEIDRLRHDPPPADELRGIQNYLAGVFVLRAATQSGLISSLEFVDLHGLGPDYLSQYVHRVYAVTPADVQRIAQQYLDPSKMAIVVVGDKKVVSNQVAPYGH